MAEQKKQIDVAIRNATKTLELWRQERDRQRTMEYVCLALDDSANVQAAVGKISKKPDVLGLSTLVDALKLSFLFHSLVENLRAG